MKEVTIDGKVFVEKCNIVAEDTIAIARALLGKPVLVRSRNEGVNAGILMQADETGVLLSDSRRLYYHVPKDKKMSWYEGVSLSGISDNSRVSCTVNLKVIVENYSLTICSNNAYKSIMEAVPNEQS